MDNKPIPMQTHFVDIHEALPEEDEERIIKMEDNDNNNVGKQMNRPIRAREIKRPQRNFSRQVSLETGFSVLNRESKAKDERGSLPRSGRSFGGFDSANRIGLEGGRKGDFSIFKTKSTLSKQKSLLPSKMEKVLESQGSDGNGNDESVNTSVPAGRYFAALRGPELDEVKVSNHYLPKLHIYVLHYNQVP